MASNFFFILIFAARFFYQDPWGEDAGIKVPPPKVEKQAPSLGARIADLIIDFHQQVISPVDGPRSHFRPTSSQYMRLAIHRYGFLKGYLMGCDRLLRENGEEWVYRTVEINGNIYKYDPAYLDKAKGLK